MARLSQDVFATGRYGPGQQVPFLADITSGASLPGGPLQIQARCTAKSTVRIRWHLIANPVLTMQRLVRSAVGPPVDAVDGDIVLDAPMGSAVEYLDTGLPGGRYVYYGIYVFDSTAQVWLRGGFADAIVVDDAYDTGTRMFQLLPGYYQDADTGFGVNNALRRFTQLPGFEFDILRTETAALAKIWDPMVGKASTIGTALKQFGISPEPEVGFAQQRALLHNITLLLANKGSAGAVTGLLTSMTGWGGVVTSGINLLADNLDAQFDGGVGHWTISTAAAGATGSVTLGGTAIAQTPIVAKGAITLGGSVVALPAVGPLTYRVADGQVNAPNGAGVLQLTYSGTTPMTARLAADGLSGAPVTAGVRYCGQILVRGIARSVTVTMNWYGIHGVLLWSTTGTPVTSDAVDWNTHVACFDVAPTGAWWAGMTVSVAGVGPGDLEYLSSAMISQVDTGSVIPAYEPARNIRITALADLVNEVRNPRFGVDTSTWNVTVGADIMTSGATLVRSTTDSPPPTQGTCAAVTTTGAGQGAWTSCLGIEQDRVFSGSCWVKTTSVTGNVRLVLRDPNGGVAATSAWSTPGTFIYPGPAVFPSPTLYATLTWQDLSTTLMSTADATALGMLYPSTGTSPNPGLYPLGGTETTTVLNLSLVCDGPMTALIGAAMVVNGPPSTSYFDGSIASPTADYMWEASADASRTHFYRRRTVRSYRFRNLLPRFLPTGAAASLLFAQSGVSVPDPVPAIGFGTSPYGVTGFGV